MAHCQVSLEGWPPIFLHPSEFAAADKAGMVERQPGRMLLRHPLFTAVIHITGQIPS